MRNDQAYRTLVIDDDPAIHDMFKDMLGPEPVSPLPTVSELAARGGASVANGFPGFELDCASQGEDGLGCVKAALAADRPYAVAFVDFRMPPGWDGLETIRQLWQQSPDLQVVICTGFNDFSWQHIIEKFGHSDRLMVLKKPFDVMQVRQIAYSLAGKWQLTRSAPRAESNSALPPADADRKFSDIQLRQSQKLESIGQLAAGIAHEINTPTQYIGDNIRFLQTSFVELRRLQLHYENLLIAVREKAVTREMIARTEEVARRTDVAFLFQEIPNAIQQSLDGVNRVAKIVRAMKDFSHPGSGQKVPVNLNQAAETTLTVAGNTWKYVADIKTDFDPQLPAVPCLPGEINQVILNLVVNAAHAIGDVVKDGSVGKGVITVTTRRRGEWVEVRVRDTGPGIPEKIRDRIFEPFFTTKPVGRGIGQGLAIAHAVVVDQHGGTLTFETEVGVGTEFILRLPLNPAAAPKREERPAEVTA